MGQFIFYRDDYADTTVIPNSFIDEYMKDANDAQIKVYLYLLRVMNAGLSTGVSEIADKFNHTEKDVIRALRYWEKAGLLFLLFDESGKNITGIRFKEPQRREKDTSAHSDTIPADTAAMQNTQPVLVKASSVSVPVRQKHLLQSLSILRTSCALSKTAKKPHSFFLLRNLTLDAL